MPNTATSPFWSLPTQANIERLASAPSGLSQQQALDRYRQSASQRLVRRPRTSAFYLLLSQFRSPITLMLLATAGLSAILGDAADAAIVAFIVVLSAGLGFWQEHSAAGAVAKLLELVANRSRVLRDGREAEVPIDRIVPGDVILLSAGATAPGDCILLDAKDLFINEAALTGETFPVEKHVGTVAADAPLAGRSNVVYLGTHVVSGEGRAIVVHIGRATEFGRISDHIQLRAPETDFERGIRRFGYFLLEVTLVLLILIFIVNIAMDRPVLEAFLFALALAVGLTPQLLPAIISVNLSHGARRMAKMDVIVRRLNSIENFGSMDVLCSDKTGTLTTGVVQVDAAFSPLGDPSPEVLHLAAVNAAFETGFANPIDEAIRRSTKWDNSAYRKLDEIPYDFIRKRLSVLVSGPDGVRLITKGALENILSICAYVATPNGPAAIDEHRDAILDQFHRIGDRGLRTLGVAYRTMPDERLVNRDAEAGMTFAGFLTLKDPIKPGIQETINRLSKSGVRLKMITGDNRLVAADVASRVGLDHGKLLTGGEIRRMSDEALLHKIDTIDVFAEVEPNQKERIILAAKKAGHVVGYLGDGINDATALHAADVGISVDDAVDVAKEAADIVLLKQDLAVLFDGILEGRTTFANTLKYVFMATSANFGNMFSMAAASLFLPFLPLLPKQILLTNVLTDLPEMAIAQDSVDDHVVNRPRRWDIAFIRRFMLVFGSISSFFDFLTFTVLLLVLRVNVEQFRTGWFLESVVSAGLVVLVIRTRLPIWKSRPSPWLVSATLAMIVGTIAIPYTPFAEVFGFAPLPVGTLISLAAVVAGYVFSAEIAKAAFYAWERRHSSSKSGMSASS